MGRRLPPKQRGDAFDGCTGAADRERERIPVVVPLAVVQGDHVNTPGPGDNTIKRLLLIPPTFFFVSLVIFLVLNVAPGRPGAVGQQDTGEQKDSATGRGVAQVLLGAPRDIEWSYVAAVEPPFNHLPRFRIQDADLDPTL